MLSSSRLLKDKDVLTSMVGEIGKIGKIVFVKPEILGLIPSGVTNVLYRIYDCGHKYLS